MFFVFLLGVYSFCDGLKFLSGFYLGIMMICFVFLLFFVLLKVLFVFNLSKEGLVMEVVLFICLFGFVIVYMIVVYSMSCSESSKFFVYKIDIEVVSFFFFYLV